LKALIGALIVVILMIGAPSVFALSRHQQAAYRSGFAHGVVDGASTDDDPWYISQWGNGFAFHSREFINGYINGFCSIPANKNVGSDDDTAEWDCENGPSSAKWFIGKQKPTTYVSLL
jgi:hypothetical protein